MVTLISIETCLVVIAPLNNVQRNPWQDDASSSWQLLSSVIDLSDISLIYQRNRGLPLLLILIGLLQETAR